MEDGEHHSLWQTSRLGYRPALDGVRAFAVGAVLAVHGGLLSGGFFGVDIFFVLSGFLITSLLIEEWVRTGTVSRRAFYARRARRLLPALFLTIAGVGLLYAAFPDVNRGIGYFWAALAAVFYVGNWAEAFHSHGSLGDLGLLTHVEPRDRRAVLHRLAAAADVSITPSIPTADAHAWACRSCCHQRRTLLPDVAAGARRLGVLPVPHASDRSASRLCAWDGLGEQGCAPSGSPIRSIPAGGACRHRRPRSLRRHSFSGRPTRVLSRIPDRGALLRSRHRARDRESRLRGDHEPVNDSDCVARGEVLWDLPLPPADLRGIDDVAAPPAPGDRASDPGPPHADRGCRVVSLRRVSVSQAEAVSNSRSHGRGTRGADDSKGLPRVHESSDGTPAATQLERPVEPSTPAGGPGDETLSEGVT